jgi:chromosome segregation ATPase
MDGELREAQRLADRLHVQLEKAQAEARSSLDMAREAYAKGLNAGSPEAALLSESVARLQAALVASENERQALQSRLAASNVELVQVRTQLGVVRERIEGMKQETANLRHSLDEANRRVDVAAGREAELRKALTAMEARKESLEWWLWRLGGALVLLILLIGVYVAGRIKGWGWIR